MKKITILTALIISFGLVKAQPFETGTNVIGLGAGLGGYYGGLGIGIGYSSIPAIGVSFDHGFKEGLGPGVIGIGGYLGYKRISDHSNLLNLFNNYYSDEKWTYLIFGLRGTYHYNFDLDDNLDLYGGLMFSYNSLISYSETSNDPFYIYHSNSYYHSYVFPSLFVGGSYYFMDNFAGFMELGYGIAYWTVGIDFKL